MDDDGIIRGQDLRDDIEIRKNRYQTCFQADAGQYVLADLYHLCHQGRSTWNGDPSQTLINEGKRQVLLHIISLLTISDMDLHQLGLRHTREKYR